MDETSKGWLSSQQDEGWLSKVSRYGSIMRSKMTTRSESQWQNVFPRIVFLSNILCSRRWHDCSVWKWLVIRKSMDAESKFFVWNASQNLPNVWVKNYCTWNKITKWFSRFQRNMTSQYVVFLCRLKWDLPNQQNCVSTNSWVHRIQVMVWGWNFMFLKIGYPLVNIQKAIENGHRNSGWPH